MNEIIITETNREDDDGCSRYEITIKRGDKTLEA